MPRSLKLLVVAIALTVMGPGAAAIVCAHLVVDGVNANAEPNFQQWCPTCASVGWYYTPSFSYDLTGIHTHFDQFNGGDRTVTVEILTDRRAVGGALLRSATFDSAVARTSTGGATFTPLHLDGGTTYFIGFRNIGGLGVNFTPQQNPVNLGVSCYLDNDGVNDGNYELRGGPANSGGILDQPILRFFTRIDDGDGVEDAVDDCPTVGNVTQADTDADGVGDACDPCNGPGIADVDANQVCDAPVPVEPNGKLTTATQIFCPATTIATTIAAATDVDFYSIFLTSGTILKVDLDAEVNGSTLDSDLVVFDAAGKRQVLSRDDAAPGETSPTNDSYLAFTAPSTGLYFVGVAAFPDLAMSEDSAFTTGAYTMSVTCTAQVDEPNNTIATATTGSCPFTTQGVEIAPGDVDYYEFTAALGQVVRIDVDAAQLGSPLDSILALFDSNGTQIGNTSFDDAAPGEPTPTTDSYIEFFVTDPGTYYVAVGASGDFVFDGSQGLSSGPYTLTVSCGPPPGEPNDTRAEATAISCNSTTVDTGIPLAGDVDFYAVDLIGGQIVTLDLDHVGSRFDPELDSMVGVFDADGNLVTLNDDGPAPGESRNGVQSFLQFQVPASGTYFIGVTSWDDFDFDGDSDAVGALTTGRYSLALTCAAAVPGTIVPIAWDRFDASVPVHDESSVIYALPFTFPWFGRNIVRIAVNTNGLVELLEQNDVCGDCPTDDTFGDRTHFKGNHVSKNIDAFFAANDDLITGAVIEALTDRVEIIWMGPTFNDYDPNFDVSKQLAFKVVLFDDGRVQWKFFDMAYTTFGGDNGGDLFSGYYDEVANVEREVPGGSLAIKGKNVHKAFQFTPGSGHPDIAPIPWDPKDAGIAATNDDDVVYTLPFPFPWYGRQITKVSVNTNGLVELLENGESCKECTAALTHFQGDHVGKNIDALFAANDDLDAGVVIEGFPDRVEIIWIGATTQASDFTVEPLSFKLILFPNGRVEWKFFDMDYNEINGDLFSGLYDEIGNAPQEIYGGSTSFAGQEVQRAFRFIGQFEGPPGSPSCSDGIDNDGDQQTDGSDGDCDGCGDGNQDAGEACDDGDAENGDGCDTNCTVSACGNGIVAGAEACDPQAQPTGCGFKQSCVPVGDPAACTCVAGASAQLDHFLGYKVKSEIAFPKGVHAFLADALATALYDVKKPLNLLLPANKNGEGIQDEATHLRAYQLALTKARCADNSISNVRGACNKEPDCGGVAKTTTFCAKQPKAPKHLGIHVENQFHPNGELVLDLGKPDRLLVPTAKSLAGPIPPPDPTAHGVDNFTCYQAKVGKGAAKFPKGIQASVVDQFNQPKTYDVKKPVRLCIAADENDEGLKDPEATLLCYQVKSAKGQPKHVPVKPIFLDDQFGADRVATTKDEELCVPSVTISP